MPNLPTWIQQLLQRLATPTPSPTDPANLPKRTLYAATTSDWGIQPTGWRSFLDALPPLTVQPDEDERRARPSVRRRPKIAGVTASPMPRGLLVARGGRFG